MEKTYKSKVLIVTMVVAVICVVINVVFCIVSAHTLEREYFGLTEESFLGITNNINGDFIKADAYLSDLNEADVASLKTEVHDAHYVREEGEPPPEGYNDYTWQLRQLQANMIIKAFLDKIEDFSRVTYVYESGDSGDYGATTYYADGIDIKEDISTPSSAFILRAQGLMDGEIYSFMGGGSEVYGSGDAYYYSVKKANNGYLVVGISAEKLLANLPPNNFSSIILIAKRENDVLWTTQTDSFAFSKDGFLPSLTDSVRSKVTAGDSFTKTTTYSAGGVKENVIFTVADIGENYPDIRLAAYLSSKGFIDYRASGITTRIIESVVAFVAWVVGVLLIMFFLQNSGNNKSFRHSRNNYIVEITRKGDIIWMNHNFKREYGVQSNLNKITEAGALLDQISEGKSVVFTLTNRAEEERHIMMHSLYYSSFMRLIGADMTDEIDDYNKLKDADINDSLTHLPVEKVFSERIDKMFIKDGKIEGALAMLKLTNMPTLKIMMGENSFNQLVTVSAEFVEKILKPYGELYYTRSGNFLLFTPDREQGEKLITELPSIMEQLMSPLSFMDNKIKLDARVGVVTLSAEEDIGISSDSLISNAQASLENSFESKTGYYVMHPSSFAVARTNFTALGMIQKMVQNNEIETYFQPQLSLKTGKITGFEGLCRISGPKAREITTGELIAIAEQYGGMIGLGNFIYNKAMSFAQSVQDMGVQVSVNVSPIQLVQEGFTDNFLKSYKRFGIKKGMFNIEITESIALYSFGEVTEKLIQLESNGINIHIDDFGVAYSSLMQIKRLPITTIKIDKGLIDDIAFNKSSKALVKNVIALSKDLGCEVVAEGVEKEEQVDALKELGCDIIQGYIVGKAMPMEQALEKITETNKDKGK